MKQTELRPGNIVDKLFGDSKQYQWSFFRVDEYEELKEYPDVFRPTKLNENWLITLGFTEEDEDFIIETGRQGFIVSKAQDEDLLLLYRSDVGLDYNSLVFIESIHQLQNIYFDLTGNELTIKRR